MKRQRHKFRPWLAALLGIALSTAAQAQLPEERWIGGIRYLIVYNTTPIWLRCRILDAGGHWFWADIAPGQHVFKPVHPSNAAQWQCLPTP